MSWDTLGVIAIVAVAAVYLVYRYARKKPSGCGCGCSGGCGGSGQIKDLKGQRSGEHVCCGGANHK
ncbi:hypothetical protein [Oleidesulfovibrio sp.]|uniref:hypothetical protein n=1 Tax=Oleidesulfovibrio sp. TaxID=2909707 RepID=UPI003A8ACF41